MTLKVSTNSNPNKLAKTLENEIINYKVATMSAVGAGAVNQAVKAIVIVRRFLVPNGIYISFIPHFETIKIGDRDITALNLIINKINY